MHASEVTQVKMRYDIWHMDPPNSSYPACIAVKTAGLQSDEAANQYLFELRRSIMEEGVNISKQDVLFSIAQTIAAINFDQFQQDWNSGIGKNAFREDIQQAKYHGIGRYPTLTFQNRHAESFMIVGYRPFEALEQAFQDVLTISNK